MCVCFNYFVSKQVGELIINKNQYEQTNREYSEVELGVGNKHRLER